MSMASQNIRIRLKSFDSKLIDKSSREIADTARRSGALVNGPTPLPTKQIRTFVAKSPHAQRKHRGAEHYEIRVHKRVILLTNPTDKTMDALMKLELAAGVDVQIAVVGSK